MAIRLKQLDIPPHYRAANFESFKATAANEIALRQARRFCELYNPLTNGSGGLMGLLLTGSVGTGKTYLASATAGFLVRSMGIRGKFLDCRQFYDRLRASYDDQAQESQARILGELDRVDLVVIDELGAVRPSEWVTEVTDLVIGSLYNRDKPILVTTNFPNLPPGAGSGYDRGLRAETLGDRIGMRMWSRLQQMCMPVDMTGPDWRVLPQ